MKLVVNGKEVEIERPIQTANDLLNYYALETKPVILELNGQIVMKDVLSSTPISEGDRIEIVHFVGGG
ncbi:sulfur carrier protein ThiS [Calidifontibacillus erzurumensis]|uniref:Sulfur carrier protein ThiS n=1 Tax=Calidifontibacillus erzurumensis TaxID=2741433 RepID=A0A8J8KDF3_9BACI|nr:sulfur carrier protein ThiS [Calidifontibacillus erzurumensis]NSL50620.1 sulfur carrier protein ThiS [Calidifontibacillus erzurumensis]